MINSIFVSQLFDKEGYYTSEFADTKADLRIKVANRTNKVKAIIFATLPYEVVSPGSIPDVSLPAKWKVELADIIKSIKED